MAHKMTRFHIFALKNAMLTANMAASAVGGILLFIIYEFVLRDHHSDRYVEFHLQVSSYLSAVSFTLLFVIILAYERPIRRYFHLLTTGFQAMAEPEPVVRRRLLNAPYFMVCADMATWILTGLALAVFERRFGLSWTIVSINRFEALLVGLICTTSAFFLLERILQKYLAPIVFPAGKLLEVKGVRRINLTVRLFSVFIAINLLPMLAILISLYRISISGREPTESLAMLTGGLWIAIPVVIFIGGGLVLTIALYLKRSLSAMVDALQKIKAGRFDTGVAVTTNDEIGYVGDSINEMVAGLRERDELKHSLDLAKEIQQNLLPDKKLYLNGLDIAGQSIYCDETGGDYFDFITFKAGGSQKIGIAIGDVSGHGISAALLMATFRSSLRQRLSHPGKPDQIITDVNRQLAYDVEASGNFMTLFYLCIEPDQQILKWVRAGHDPGILYDPAADTFDELRGNGIALGVDPDFSFETNQRDGPTAGQIVVLYTDGVWEAHNRKGESFGKARLHDAIRHNAGQNASAIIQSVISAVRQFKDGADVEDDITMVVIKFKNEAGKGKSDDR